MWIIVRSVVQAQRQQMRPPQEGNRIGGRLCNSDVHSADCDADLGAMRANLKAAAFTWRPRGVRLKALVTAAPGQAPRSGSQAKPLDSWVRSSAALMRPIKTWGVGSGWRSGCESEGGGEWQERDGWGQWGMDGGGGLGWRWLMGLSANSPSAAMVTSRILTGPTGSERDLTHPTAQSRDECWPHRSKTHPHSRKAIIWKDGGLICTTEFKKKKLLWFWSLRKWSFQTGWRLTNQRRYYHLTKTCPWLILVSSLEFKFREFACVFCFFFSNKTWEDF